MVKFFVVIILIFLAVAVMAGDEDVDIDDEDPNYFIGFVEEPLRIDIQGKPHDIYYKELLPYDGSKKSWRGMPVDLVEYEIKDFENKETPFFVYMRKRTRHYHFFVIPYNNYEEPAPGSILQKIIEENEECDGRVIFRDIFDQIDQKVHPERYKE